MSTICGHLFCENCIRTSIRTKKECPTCRRRLTARGIHPIFI
ncbi:E3 ubiquitin-protein ligase RNF4-like protein [Dinothrombium tinctorium]|uniref:E3 ubiquitin-protein ligase RNF4-like protein n=1 Tax=Dinothrombium tinctorium TaxID=1965070 RepID=A0A443QYH4_9ACAR|nr:E3 ubiquitin-protein ligase RNF4-like protein [Dinothrombium tinctorium]